MWSGLASLALIVAIAVPASAADDCPITAVPSDRWGALEPRAVLGDGSCWDFDRVPSDDDPYWHAVDVENGWVFGAAGKGITIHDARNDAANPVPRGPHSGYKYAPDFAPAWYQSDQKFYVFDVDAPDGVDTVVATASSGNGLLVWNTQDKDFVSIHYQDEGAGEATEVYVATISQRHYAFVTVQDGSRVYDLSKATEYESCNDHSRDGRIDCPGVYLGRMGTGLATKVDGNGDFVAVGMGPAGIEIWDVSDPASPQVVMSGGEPSSGVALWEWGGKVWLAGTGTSFRVYDVSRIATSECASTPCALPAPARTMSLDGNPATVVYSEATGTWSDGTQWRVPFLFVSVSGNIGTQLEWLFDVSTPTAPRDITPQSHPDGYWGWYYAKNDTGFRWVSAGAGVFEGSHLYHTGFGLYDVHAWVDPPTQTGGEDMVMGADISDVAGDTNPGGDTVGGMDTSSTSDTGPGDATGMSDTGPLDGTDMSIVDTRQPELDVGTSGDASPDTGTDGSSSDDDCACAVARAPSGGRGLVVFGALVLFIGWRARGRG